MKRRLQLFLPLFLILALLVACTPAPAAPAAEPAAPAAEPAATEAPSEEAATEAGAGLPTAGLSDSRRPGIPGARVRCIPKRIFLRKFAGVAALRQHFVISNKNPSGEATIPRHFLLIFSILYYEKYGTTC